jgi:hypothetical protein
MPALPLTTSLCAKSPVTECATSHPPSLHIYIHAVAATYVLNTANTNVCVSGYSKITDQETCTAAAAFIGKSYYRSDTVANEPAGCILNTRHSFVYLNLHPTGGPNGDYVPLCKVLPTTAHGPGSTPTRTPTPSPTTLMQSPRVGIVATGTPISQAPIIAVVAPSASPSTASPTASSQQMLLATAPGNETVKSSSNTKAIAGGIGGAVAAVLLVFGAVILRKTCRKLKAKDAAKPDASTHELQRKDRAEALKLGAGASLATNAPWLRLITAGRWLQVGRWLLRLRPPLCF